MSDEVETEWLTATFGFKIVGRQIEWPEGDRNKEVLRGLAKTMAYLLLPEDDDYEGVKVFASSLTIKEGYLFTDDMLSKALEEWGEDPQP